MQNITTTIQIGTLDKRIIDLLGLDKQEDSPIFIGPQNIQHMQNSHPDDYAKYGDKICEIISSPTYVAKHPRKESIEYIKVYEQDNDHVLVAVRASGRGVLFARTLFVMSDEKVEKYKLKNAFKQV